MDIKIIRATHSLGWAYKAGMTARLPDEVAKELIEGGYAIPVEGKRRPKKEVKPEVLTTQVTRSRKRPVKK